MRLAVILPAFLSIAHLCGCATASNSASSPGSTEPDCSFRSATTCWTSAGRFPPPARREGQRPPNEMLRQSPTVVTRGADSTRGFR
jgi:hypothetical protein